MKCVVCNSGDIVKKMVDEEFKSGDDIILYPFEVLVCNTCGERYYDRPTMIKLEEIRKKVREKTIVVAKVGNVFRPRVA